MSSETSIVALVRRQVRDAAGVLRYERATAPDCRDRVALVRAIQALGVLGCDDDLIRRLVVDGLAVGRTRYGTLDLATDRRDWRQEAVAELRDAVVYLAAAVLRGGRR